MCKGTPAQGIGFFEGFAGTVRGGWFNVPLYVDLAKKPGHTSQWGTVVEGWTLPWLKGFISPVRLVYSPNFVWLVITLAMYFLFPYDLKSEAAKTMSFDLVKERVLLHLGVTHAFFGFWTVAVYFAKKSKRFFSETEHGPSLSRMVHNLWYASLGGVQSGVWDVFFIHAFATGRKSYVEDWDAFSLSMGGVATVGFVTFGMMWRGAHFFLAHKLVHFNVLYKHVHALHHRNVSIEPYCGLTMHPIEHMYYFGCAGIGMYLGGLGGSALLPFWILFHCLLSPAASHSGVEDIWQSDQFHNIHHQKFECNYGGAGIPLDYAAGSFREKLGKSECYTGGWNEETDEDASVTKKDGTEVKQFLRGGLTLKGALYGSVEQLAYDAICCVGFPALVVLAFTDMNAQLFQDLGLPWHLPDPSGGHNLFDGEIYIDSLRFVSLVMTYGPILVGTLFYIADGGHRSWRWPFQKVWLLTSLAHLFFLLTCRTHHCSLCTVNIHHSTFHYDSLFISHHTTGQSCVQRDPVCVCRKPCRLDPCVHYDSVRLGGSLWDQLGEPYAVALGQTPFS